MPDEPTPPQNDPSQDAPAEHPTLAELREMPLHERARVAGEPMPDHPMPADPPIPRDTLRALEKAAIEEDGIPSQMLMEAAGIATADEIVRALRQMRSAGGSRDAHAAIQNARGETIERFSFEELGGTGVVGLCGPGNNGGDALVALRHLHGRGADAIALLLAPRSEIAPDSDTGRNLAWFESVGGIVREIRSAKEIEGYEDVLRGADVLIDGMFGTGLNRALGEPYATAITYLNDLWLLGKLIVACDIPSGLDAETGEIHGIAVRARLTTTYAAVKPAMHTETGRFYCGQVTLHPIGLPRDRLAEPVHAAWREIVRAKRMADK